MLSSPWPPFLSQPTTVHAHSGADDSLPSRRVQNQRNVNLVTADRQQRLWPRRGFPCDSAIVVGGDVPRALDLLGGLLLLGMSGCASDRANARAIGASDALSSDKAAPDEAEPPPPQSGLWAPDVPVASTKSAITWAEVELMSACSAPEPSLGNASPVSLITTEAGFEARYCRPSSVDWNRFRLAVIPYSDTLLDISVVADESRVRVLVWTERSCEGAWGHNLHLLLPAGKADVVLVRKPGLQNECSDGYGY